MIVIQKGLAIMRACPICDSSIDLAPGRRTCSYCGQTEEGDHACSRGHYTCQACRRAVPSELVARVCLNSSETDPYKMANLILSHHYFNQMGPQFHIVAGPVIIAALANQGFIGSKAQMIPEAVERLKDVPALACSSRGICGAAAGAGAAVSLISQAGPLKARERSQALKYSSDALRVIAEQGGIRCCRQSVLSTLETALSAIRKDYGYEIKAASPQCGYPQRNPECKKGECPYYGKIGAADKI